MASRWMQPKLDKMRRDRAAAPTAYELATIAGSKADMRLICKGAMVQLQDQGKKVHREPEGARRHVHFPNEPRFDKRTYGNFKRTHQSRHGLIEKVALCKPEVRLIPAR